MFDSKLNQLFRQPESKKKSSGNAFINNAKKESAIILSGNYAKKYSTTGNSFVDQFGKLGKYKESRSYENIAKDCETLWAENKLLTVAFIFYIRMITRVVTFFDGTSTKVSQKGAELKHEGVIRMIWLHMKAPDTFWKNITLFISIGSWKDVFKMLSYDLIYHNWNDRVLDWDKFGNLILSGLENPQTTNLVKKYLPTIKSNSKCTTPESQANNLIGKWICSLLYGNKGEESGYTYKKYRKLKSSGTAHEWQQLISQQKFDRIEFDKIHGRALNLLVRSKFLFNQGLSEKYANWVSKDTTEVKYTGFVHELFSKLPPFLTALSTHVQDTINKQFYTLIKKGGDKELVSFIVVRDTSSSMNSPAKGTNMSCYNIGKALALYFSEFLTGIFANHWIEFNNGAKMHTWKGNTPLEKWYNDHTCAYASTNFQSVIDLFCNMLQQDIPEEDFPTGILCISDGEFNPTSLNKTNVEVVADKLTKAGFSNDYVSNFTIVLWNLQNSYCGNNSGEKFDSYGNMPNVFYFSGYSASTVSFLTGMEVKTAEELFLEAMNQEALDRIEL